MKKILLLVILLFVVSCGSYVEPVDVVEEIPIYTVDETEVVDVEETVEEMEDEVVEVDYTLSSDEEELLESRFTSYERVEISRPLVKGLVPGEVYVLGLAIRNILGQATHDFVITIDLVEMRDYSNSMYDTDDALLEAWFDRTDFGPYTMERNDEIIVPLIVEVGNMMTAEDAVLPGNYIFHINVAYETDGEGMTDPYETLELTLQVAE